MQPLLDPTVLFFGFGALAAFARSNLEIPPPISRFLSLYLLMALGLKGGFALAHTGFTPEVATGLACAVLLAVAVPALGYALLRRFTSGFDAAAIAATYGSVSAVTFVTAVQSLEQQQIAHGGHMAAAMALMESPAIVMAVLLSHRLRLARPVVSALAGGGALVAGGPRAAGGPSVGALLRESFTDGAQLLLLGSMAVGLITGEAGKAALQPFAGDLFKGMLAFFLLDMGLLAARSMPRLRDVSSGLAGYALLAPLVHASAALALARVAGLPAGDTALLMVLAASASYIAVPAVLRHAIPEASPSLYLGLSLGITFPFNILVGIPLYTAAALHFTA